jgi:hypothetical protein
MDASGGSLGMNVDGAMGCIVTVASATSLESVHQCVASSTATDSSSSLKHVPWLVSSVQQRQE